MVLPDCPKVSPVRQNMMKNFLVRDLMTVGVPTYDNSERNS
jgi:hypothetical protein